MAGQLVLRVLGECDQGVIEEFRFYAGEERILKLQLFDYEDKQKWVMPAGASVELTLAGTPDDIIIENTDITIDTDRSIFSTTLQEVTTALLITGLIIATITYSDGAQDVVRIAEKSLGMKKVT